jgi:glutamine synthetase
MDGLNLDQLRNSAQGGRIDTVLLAFTDMQGRLQGKRLTAGHFLDSVVEHGAEACNYLMAVDVDMNTVDGYEISSWDKGYGDFAMVPDLARMVIIPWHPKTALCLADLAWDDGAPVVQSPRQVLKHQLERLSERGLKASAATELEFIVFKDTYEEAFAKGYRDLVPANLYNLDYSLLATGRLEPLIGRIRRQMGEAGLKVENSKGECNDGQHEINFTYSDALAAADGHTVYKTGAKEIAAQEGMAITFMAKYNEREGSSCHIHLSLRGLDGDLVFWDGDSGKRTALYDHFVAGVLATTAELTLLYAPNINSYKRFADGSFAPTTIAWGLDNRTCAVRLVGQGPAARMENRVPGADVNPYLALAAMLAGGLHGIENELPLEDELVGNAYTSGRAKVPHTMRAARDLFHSSQVARQALGDEVVDHYVNMADVELAAYDAAVTDWELRRGFERL